MSIIKSVPIKNTDSPAVKTIKEKLNAFEGIATIVLYSGENCEIWFDEDDRGIVSPKLAPSNQLGWEDFDAAVEVVINNGGKAKKGNAQSGARLGSPKLMLNSVEGYIAHKVHGVEKDETAFGPGFVICAVLDWAEVCNNNREYLSIRPTFLEEYKKLLMKM